MDIESKIWNYSNTGTKLHAFLDGVALCRSSIRRPGAEDNALDYCEAKGHPVCTACDIKFNAAIERAEASMQPSTGEGDYLPPADVTAPEEKEDDMSSPRSRPVTGPLTQRQMDVLGYISKGMTHQATAQELGVSRVWVSENMRMAVSKMGVTNSWEAVARWMRRQALLDAADMIERVRITAPVDDTEQHVNHVLDALAQTLRDRANRLLPV